MFGRVVIALFTLINVALSATIGQSLAEIPDETIESSLKVEYDESGKHLLSIC